MDSLETKKDLPVKDHCHQDLKFWSLSSLNVWQKLHTIPNLEFHIRSKLKQLKWDYVTKAQSPPMCKTLLQSLKTVFWNKWFFKLANLAVFFQPIVIKATLHYSHTGKKENTSQTYQTYRMWCNVSHMIPLQNENLINNIP